VCGIERGGLIDALREEVRGYRVIGYRVIGYRIIKVIG